MSQSRRAILDGDELAAAAAAAAAEAEAVKLSAAVA
jgi:hypothetical protein